MQLDTQHRSEVIRSQTVESDAFAAAPVAMLVTDNSFRIITANNTAIRILSPDDSDLSGHPLFDYCIPDNSSLEIESCIVSLRSKRRGRFQPCDKSPNDGRVNPAIEITITDLRDDRYLLVCEEATESCENIVELDRMLTRGEMAGEISDNTPWQYRDHPNFLRKEELRCHS